MASILLTWELGAGAGHLHPMASIAVGLRERGHRVHLAVRDVTTAEAILTPLGLPFSPAPLWLGRVAPNTPPSANYAELLARVGFLDPRFVGGQLRAWLNLFALTTPDLLIADHSPGALLAARVAGIKRAACGVAFGTPPPESPMPSMQPWANIPRKRLVQSESLILSSINAALKPFPGAALEQLANLFDTTTSYLNTFPPLDHYGERPGVRYWGLIQATKVGETPAWPKGEGPKIYVYFPYTLPQFRPLVAELVKLGLPTLFVSHGIPRHLADELAAPNIRFSPSLVDLGAVAHESAFVVNRVNHGTVAELLRRGCRQLVIPHEIEQAQLAYQLSSQGLALTANHTQKDYASLIRAGLEDRTLGDRVEAFARRYGDWRPERQLTLMLEDLERLL